MLTKSPTHIWRMSTRSKNEQVKITERFLFEFMEGPLFTGDHRDKVLATMHTTLETGVVTVDGRPIYVAYNRLQYDLAGVEDMLNRLYLNQFGTSAFTRFDWANWSQWLTLEKQNTKRRQAYMTDAWLDLDYGLFWTWEKINVKDIIKNIQKSIEFAEMPDHERRKHLTREPGRVNMEHLLGDLKSRMEHKGLLKR